MMVTAIGLGAWMLLGSASAVTVFATSAAEPEAVDILIMMVAWPFLLPVIASLRIAKRIRRRRALAAAEAAALDRLLREEGLQ